MIERHPQHNGIDQPDHHDAGGPESHPCRCSQPCTGATAMTMISARNTGPISQATAWMPATVTTNEAIPRRMITPRGSARSGPGQFGCARACSSPHGLRHADDVRSIAKPARHPGGVKAAPLTRGLRLDALVPRCTEAHQASDECAVLAARLGQLVLVQLRHLSFRVLPDRQWVDLPHLARVEQVPPVPSGSRPWRGTLGTAAPSQLDRIRSLVLLVVPIDDMCPSSRFERSPRPSLDASPRTGGARAAPPGQARVMAGRFRRPVRRATGGR